MTNFKHFSPLQRLNKGLFQAKVFEGDTKINLFGGKRYHRFAACEWSFQNNLLGLNYCLRRIGEHFQLKYKKEDREGAAENKIIQNTVLLAFDLETFFLKIKTLLDCVAFFIPFYFSKPLYHDKKDARDLKHPWAFKVMKEHFINGKTQDKAFHKILISNNDWTEDVMWKRNILCHRFHRLSVSHDYWTNSCYAYLYEFNRSRDFIPDILLYVSSIYFQLVVFLKAMEAHFKNKCEKEITGYKYFYEGSSFASKTDKLHYFFASLGKFINGKILIRIHPGMRHEIDTHLKKVLSDLKIKCQKCNKIFIKIDSKVENFVLITAHCNCGNIILLGEKVSKRFFPYFFDRNENHWELVPIYKLQERMTF